MGENHKYWHHVMLTMLAPAIWGSTYIVTSEFLPSDRPFTAALIRTLPAGIILLIFKWKLPTKSHWWKLIILSALNIGLFQSLLFISAYRLPGGLAAVLGTIQPIIIMMLIWAADGYKPKFLTLFSCICGFIGMGMLFLSPNILFDVFGIIAALLGATCMATGVWLTGRWKIDLPLLPMTGWQLLCGGLMLVPMALIIDDPLPSLTFTQLSAYTYLSIVGALFAYIIWFRGIALLPSVAVASLGLLSPITAIALGWIFLNQTISGTALIGFIAVLISVLTVQLTIVNKK